MKPEGQKTNVFISYSHADERWFKRLHVHLAPLNDNQYDIDLWSDKRIKPGTKWREEIRKAVKKADVAILLVSADYLASEFIRKHELPRCLKRQRKREN